MKEGDIIRKDGKSYKVTLEEVEESYSGALYIHTGASLDYWVVRQENDGAFQAERISIPSIKYLDYAKNVFETESHAQQFADALNTMAELRETSVLPVDGVEQYTLSLSFNKKGQYWLISYSVRYMKGKLYSPLPYYATWAEAEELLRKVGDERIIKMLKVFKGIYDE